MKYFTQFWSLFISALMLSTIVGPTKFARADVSFSSELSKSSISTDESVYFTVTVKGEDAETIGAPTFEQSKEFTVDDDGRSVQVTMLNGKIESSVVYSYRLQPSSDLKPGEYEIPSAYWQVNGKRIELPKKKIRITRSSTSGRQFAAFAQVVDDIAPYVGEQIIYRAEVATPHRLLQTDLPDVAFSGFARESFGRQREALRVISGSTTTVYTIREALFPISSGPIEIPARSGEVLLQVIAKRPSRRGWGMFPDLFPDMLAQYEQRRAKVEAKPITIEVQPLPPKPIKWEGPVPVGTITLDYAVDRRTIELGETVEFDIVISGDGDLRSLTLPLDTLPKEFKVYQSQPELTSTINNERVSFKKRFRFALLPQQSGLRMVPPIRILTFSPSKQDYRVLEIPGIPLTVRPSADGRETLLTESPAADDKPEVTPQNESIAEDGYQPLKRDSKFARLGGPAVAALEWIGIGTLIFSLGWLILRRLRSIAQTGSFRARRTEKRLLEITASKVDTSIDELRSTLKDYISLLDALPIVGMNSKDVHSDENEFFIHSKELLDRIEKLRYRSSRARPDEVEELKRQVKELISKFGVAKMRSKREDYVSGSRKKALR